MGRIFFAMIFGWFISSAVFAQDTMRKIACHAADSTEPGNRDYKKKLWDGYEISLGPTRRSQGDGDDCTAAIYNSAGRVVFRTTGYNVIFDEKQTGQDFDGDGNPEVVFLTDTGGGNRCCWAYNVIALAPKPHKLFDIEEAGAVRFEKDSQGKMLVWQGVAGMYGFTSMARTPGGKKVFRIRDGKLTDATPEFCARIFSEENEDYREWNEQLTPGNLKLLQSMGTKFVENEDIVSALISRALQHVFCRQYDAAMADLNLWPEGQRKEMKTQFAGWIKKDYPDFAAAVADSNP